MVFLGGISYSLYLWHWPIINLYGDWRGKAPGLVTGPVLVAVSVLLAWLTKIFVEDKVRLSPVLTGHGWRSVSVALAAAVPVVLVSVYLANPVTWNGRLPASGYPGAAALASTTASRVPAEPVLPPIVDATADMPKYWLDNCLDAQPRHRPRRSARSATPSTRSLTVAMVGDSIEGNWFPALESDRPAAALEAGHRPARHLRVDRHDDGRRHHRRCVHGLPQWGQAALHDLVTTIKPNVVITSGLPENGTVADPTPGPAAFKAIGVGDGEVLDGPGEPRHLGGRHQGDPAHRLPSTRLHRRARPELAQVHGGEG